MSNQWQGIIFDDPRSGHPMLPLVIKVMRCIYRTVNPTRPPPFTVMKWRHSQSLSYQVHEDGYVPSIVILNLREGQQDSTMKTLFTINLNTMTVNDKVRNRHFPVPNEIGSSLRELDEYVRTIVREKKEAEVEEARRRQAFYRCLFDKGLIDEDYGKSFSIDSLLCPICSSQQTSCSKCKIISCSNSDCAASSAVPIVRCSQAFHQARQFCTSCLESPGSLPQLGRCPTCSRLFCSRELNWCVGRPISDDGGIATSSSNPEITRVHSARPLSCNAAITCMSNGQNGRQCSNPGCWSIQLCSTKVCPECTTQDSFSCPCGRYWTCGGCESQSSTVRRLLTCPRCLQCFCPSCSYIRACKVCRRVGLCNDCMEEVSEEAEHTPDGNLLVQCQNCQSHLCNACDDGGKSCCTCSRVLCRLCEEECKRCSHFRRICGDDYGFFEFGSGGEMIYHNF
ncbi:hypothetical protein F4604DRAFT_1238847 [Suillus subluteus]|nr:hypothetical protein F4604DRAFT_1238847 [Suillus subluteus]